MQLIWKVEPEEIKKLQDFIVGQSNNVFVRNRIRTNVEDPPTLIKIDTFWHVLVGCLLSTQQRSGPHSPVSRLLAKKPFPLSYTYFEKHSDPEPATREILKSFGGIRFINRIPNQLFFKDSNLCMNRLPIRRCCFDDGQIPGGHETELKRPWNRGSG